MSAYYHTSLSLDEIKIDCGGLKNLKSCYVQFVMKVCRGYVIDLKVFDQMFLFIPGKRVVIRYSNSTPYTGYGFKHFNIMVDGISVS